MRLSELLFETTAESHFLANLSNKLSRIIIKDYGSDINQYLGSISDLINVSVDNDSLKKLLDTGIELAQLTPEDAANDEVTDGIFQPAGKQVTKKNIPLSTDSLKDEIELVYNNFTPVIRIDNELVEEDSPSAIIYLASALIHELRHALDYIKSSGKIYYGQHKGEETRGKHFAPKFVDTERDSYESTPAEINARVEQAMYAIKRWYDFKHGTISRQELLNHIDSQLLHYSIDQYFPDGVKDKEYRRIINRILSYIGYIE